MKSSLRAIFFAVFTLALLPCSPASAKSVPPVRDFVAGSYAQLVAAPRTAPLVLALWSLDCAHCPASLRVLAQAKRAHPSLNLVLIATDVDASPALLRAHVRELGLGNAPLWRFADPLPERLRSEIDPRWWGEVPRTYLINAQGERSALSGVIKREALEKWLAKAGR